MAKSLESAQNNALNQFRHAAMGNQHDKLQSYLQLSQEKRQQFLENQKKKNAQGPAIGGFTIAKLSEIEASIEDKKKQKIQLTENSINNKNRHSMLNTALEVFGIHDLYNVASLKELSKQDFQLLDTENIKVSMLVGRCLSSSVKLTVTVSTLKSYYAKSETFDIDGSTVIAYKWIDETFKFTARYGDLMAFRRSLLPNLTKIVETFNIEDENIRVLSEDIWSFDF